MRHALLIGLILVGCTEGVPVAADDAGALGGPSTVRPEDAWQRTAPTDAAQPPPPAPRDAGPQLPPGPPAEDTCAEAGSACDVCACRLCDAEIDACFADPACRAVVECAQRTGCSGLDCLQSCGPEIDAAGGPFSPAVGQAQALSACRDGTCGTSEAACSDADPGPPEPPQPPNPPQDPPQDPPVDPPPPNDPPPVDACANAGSACDVCTCRLCDAQLDACFADPLCQAVVDCARRTGCSGLDCLQSCGPEIDAAGGPFSGPVGRAQQVSGCRDGQCGSDEAACRAADPGPPMNPNDPPPPNDPPVDPPPDGDCNRFPIDAFCGEGVDADGVAWCEFYTSGPRASCDEICAAAGSRCLLAWDDDDRCLPDNRVDCDHRERDIICRCAL